VHFLSFGIHCMHSAYELAYTPILHSDGEECMANYRPVLTLCITLCARGLPVTVPV